MSFINEAGWDRVVRVLVGIVLLFLGWGGVVPGGLGVFIQYFAFVPLITGLVGWCPLYAIVRIRTNEA